MGSTIPSNRATALIALVHKDSGNNSPTFSKEDIQTSINKENGQDKVDLQSLYDLFSSLDVDHGDHKGGDNLIDGGDTEYYFQQNPASNPFSGNSASPKESSAASPDNVALPGKDNVSNFTQAITGTGTDSTNANNNPPPPPPPPPAKIVGTVDQNTQARIDARSLVKGPDEKNKKFLDPPFDPNKTYTKDDLKQMADKIQKGKGSWKDDPFLAAINKLTAENSGEAVVFNSIAGDNGWDMNKVKDFGNSPVPNTVGDSKQQNLGDCFFLSAINALKQTGGGQQMIDNAITDNHDGSYNVTFPGDPGMVYHLDGKTIGSEFAGGDKTMQLLGAAADMYYKGHGQPNGIANGGVPSKVVEDLFKVKTKHVENKEQLEDIVKSHPNGFSMTFGSVPGPDGAASLTGGSNHAYTVKNVDIANNKVTYINPWDSSKEYTTTVDELVGKADGLQFFDT